MLASIENRKLTSENVKEIKALDLIKQADKLFQYSASSYTSVEVTNELTKMTLDIKTIEAVTDL